MGTVRAKTFTIGPTYQFKKRTSLPQLVVNIGFKSYKQKCIGGVDGEYEFELSKEVLDYSFNNIKIVHNDLDDPFNISCLSSSHEKPLTVECRDIPTHLFKQKEIHRGLFYYSREDMKLRDISPKIRLMRNYDVGDFEITLSQGLRNRLLLITPRWVITYAHPIGPMLLLLFNLLL